MGDVLTVDGRRDVTSIDRAENLNLVRDGSREWEMILMGAQMIVFHSNAAIVIARSAATI
jgi:hypothetical protein